MESHDEAYAHALLTWGRTIAVHRIAEPEDWADAVREGRIDPLTGSALNQTEVQVA